MRKLFYISLFSFLFHSIFAQQKNLPLDQQYILPLESMFAKDTLLGSFKPYIEDANITYKKSQGALIGRSEHYMKQKTDSTKWFKRKLLYQSLVSVNDTADDFRLYIDPVFNFEYARDNADTSGETLYKNTRGIRANGDVGKKFSFETTVWESQATYPQYLDTPFKRDSVIYGQSRWKGFKLNGYDYAYVTGYISYSPAKFINMQFGHGKHFVGDGYRSLLLSDNAMNYPYVRITTRYKNFQYVNLYASLMNFTKGNVQTPPFTERLFQKKYAAFQYLTYATHNRVEVSLFQGLIWQAADDQNKQHLNFYYFNPIIYTNLLKYSFDNSNNILIGANAKICFFKSLYVYGQYMLDDYPKDKFKNSIDHKSGFQLGVKSFNTFNISNLTVQAEYNQVRPYSYSQSNRWQSYSHFRQPLAHPLGANFKETIARIEYRMGRFYIGAKINYIQAGADSSGSNFGSNVMLSNNNAYYGVNSNLNEQNQGLATTVMFKDFHFSWLVNPATNFNITLGIINRTAEAAGINHKTQLFYVALRTSLNNFYLDF